MYNASRRREGVHSSAVRPKITDHRGTLEFVQTKPHHFTLDGVQLVAWVTLLFLGQAPIELCLGFSLPYFTSSLFKTYFIFIHRVCS